MNLELDRVPLSATPAALWSQAAAVALGALDYVLAHVPLEPGDRDQLARAAGYASLLALEASRRGAGRHTGDRKNRSAGVVVLAAARGLDQPFSLSDLAVACWRKRPDLFGLPGHAEHADSKRTACYLYGPRGLVSTGVLLAVGPNRYRVAEGS